jgi:pyroglutamyl-peptidase
MVDVVLTGFEPFAGAADNPSWGAVLLAAARLRAEGIAVITAELPVDFAATPPRLVELLESHKPQVFIATGVANSANAVRLEQRAVNEIDARIPDNAGAQPRGASVIVDGAAEYPGTMPVEINEVWAAAGIPWEPSADAGRYVCNATFYWLQHLAPPQTISGFIHVPPVAALPLETSAEALYLAALHSRRAVS